MDKTTRAFFELIFENTFMKKLANEFQNFFSTIMEKRYPSDFIRVRPWGNQGDRKNDGYLGSKRMLFQSYAPNELTAAECVKKIDEDFEGALPYWKLYFDIWVFVHNSRAGLPPHAVERLLHLNTAHAPLKTTQWGYEEIYQEAFLLSEQQLTS